MKKILFVLAVVGALGGCTQLHEFGSAVSLTTASVANPVTRDRLNEAEAGITIVFAGLNAYKRACVQGAADAHCRGNIRKIQAYTRQVPPLLAQLRSFVKNNDQINAVVVYNQLSQLIVNAKAAAVAVGVNLGDKS